MKIGILTFHASCNYGGLLQCWALRTALSKMGCEVRVIDRWITSSNWHLERNYGTKPFRWRFLFRLRAFLGLGENLFLRRIQRSKRFIRRWLKPTSYHFYNWNDAPRDMGLDAIVVGSEADGLTDAWRGANVQPIFLPMNGIADSLNVSVTAGILFYYALAQRKKSAKR